jgi:lysophospholipase L1-like esterase
MKQQSSGAHCSPGYTPAELQALGMKIPGVGFADVIQKYVESDNVQPPVPGGILFVGDSDIACWNHDHCFAEGFAGLPVINRGFGGARTWEVLIYFPQVVRPYRPRTIVYCAGDNDIATLKADGVASAVNGFRLFLGQVAAFLPDTRRVLYLGIHPSPSDEPLWGYIAEANRQIVQLCRDSPVAEFVDFNHLLHDAAGKICPALFRADRLHFTPAFYRTLSAFLRPRLS